MHILHTKQVVWSFVISESITGCSNIYMRVTDDAPNFAETEYLSPENFSLQLFPVLWVQLLLSSHSF